MIQIGDDVRYIGSDHTFLIGQTVQVVSVLKGYFVEPDKSIIITNNAELEKHGGITEQDLVEVAPYVNGQISFASDARLSELGPVQSREKPMVDDAFQEAGPCPHKQDATHDCLGVAPTGQGSATWSR